jgi:hypothetical protein
MHTSPPPISSTASHAPLREQRAAVLFMLFLLIVSGLTATIVGYRVKSADIERKAKLLSVYESLGGTFEMANTPGTTLLSSSLNQDQATFISAYEVNSRARTHGLYRVLETSTAGVMDQAIKSLYAIQATESARSTEDAWKAFKEPVSSVASVKNMNPKAARFARQYDRYLARDAEVKLFTFLRDHSQSIGGSN